MLALPTVVWAGVLFAIVVYLGTMHLGRTLCAAEHFHARPLGLCCALILDSSAQRAHAIMYICTVYTHVFVFLLSAPVSEWCPLAPLRQFCHK